MESSLMSQKIKDIKYLGEGFEFQSECRYNVNLKKAIILLLLKNRCYDKHISKGKSIISIYKKIVLP